MSSQGLPCVLYRLILSYVGSWSLWKLTHPSRFNHYCICDRAWWFTYGYYNDGYSQFEIDRKIAYRQGWIKKKIRNYDDLQEDDNLLCIQQMFT
jgi:hypothetical protein